MTSKRIALILAAAVIAAILFWRLKPSEPRISPVTTTSTSTTTILPEPAPVAPVATTSAPLPVSKPVKPVAAPVVKKPVPSKPAAAKPVVPAPAPTPTPVPPAPVPPPAPPEASHPTEWRGQDTSVKHSGQVVLRNDRQWVQFWSEHHPGEAAPEVDFSQYSVIGVFVGERPAEPFEVEILSVKPGAKEVVVEYRERNPPTGTFAVNVSVYPYALKVIPKTALPVKFKLLAPVQP